MELKQKIWDLFWSQEWNIGFFRGSFDYKKLSEISWMKTDYKGGWFADPFILDITDNEIEVLVEEFNYRTKKGRIDLLTVSKDDYRLKHINVLLECRTHLSFPAIFRHHGKIYVYPENSEAGVLCIYEYNTTTKKLGNQKVILRDNVVDAIIRHDTIQNELVLFATKYGSLEDNKTLLIYKTTSLDKEFSLAKTINLKTYSARGAGDWLNIDNLLVRPSQDGANLNEYGKGIILSVVNNNNYLSFKAISRIYPTSYEYPLGIHTINQFEDYCVVDGLKYRRPLLGKLTWNIKKMIKEVIR